MSFDPRNLDPKLSMHHIGFRVVLDLKLWLLVYVKSL